MDTQFVVLAFGAFFLAALLKGAAGIGFATACLGFLTLFVDIRLAIPLVILPSLASNVLVMLDAGNFRAVFRRFRLLYAAAVPGLIVGLWILGGGDTRLPRAVLGLSMLCYGVFGLWGGRLRLPDNRIWQCSIGGLTGLINGLTGSQIMPVLPYLLSLDLTKDEMVQAINASFTIASLIMLAGLGRLGLLSADVMFVSAAGVLPVGAGIWLGGRARRSLPESAFRKIVLGLVVLLGAALVARAAVE